MGQLKFLHESFCDYLCAEGLRETDLAPYVKNYAKWGSALHLLPDLADETELEALIIHCQYLDWRKNDFSLDCLPRLYVRVGQPEKLWHLVGNEEFQREKVKRQFRCYRPLPADVRSALELAVKRHSLPEMVRFGFLLPWAAFTAGFSDKGRAVTLAKEGKYDAALRQVDLLTDPPLQPVRYRILLIIAWMAVINSDRDDPERTGHHLDNTRRALQQALQTEDTIPSQWSEVVLKLVETLLSKGISEATEIIKRFGRRQGEEDKDREYACHYLAQLAMSSVLPRNVRENLVCEAETLAQNLPAEDHPSELAFTASAYASLNQEEDAKRIYEGLVAEFKTRLRSGETDPGLARLVEVVTGNFGDVRDCTWAVDICSRLLPGKDHPQPFRGYILACVGERLWDLDKREEAWKTICSAVSAVEGVCHPLAQTRVLTRVVQAALEVEGEDQGEILLRLLNLCKKCLENHLKLLPNFLEWNRKAREIDRSLSSISVFQQEEDLWEGTGKGCPPEELAWIRKGSAAGWPASEPIQELTSLACSLLEALEKIGREALVGQAHEIITTFIKLLDSVGAQELQERVHWSALDALWDIAVYLDRIEEDNPSSQAVQSFVRSFQHLTLKAKDGMAYLLTGIYVRKYRECLSKLVLSRQDFWEKHQKQLECLDWVREIRPVLETGGLICPDQCDEEDRLFFEMEARMSDYLRGAVRPKQELVDQAKEYLGRGDFVQAAACFEMDALLVEDCEKKRQYEGFMGLTLLTLARRLGRCGEADQAKEIVDILIRSFPPEYDYKIERIFEELEELEFVCGEDWEYCDWLGRFLLRLQEAFAEEKVTHPIAREEFCPEYADVVSIAEAEGAYVLLEQVLPNQRGEKWVWEMTKLLSRRGRDQGWPSQWSRRLAGLLCLPYAGRITTMDFVLGQLVSLCPDKGELLKVAETCRTIRWFSRGSQ